MADMEKNEAAKPAARPQPRRTWVTPVLTVASVEVAEDSAGSGGDLNGRS